MSAALVCLLLCGSPQEEPLREVPPREIPWTELTGSHFDLRWCLPEPGTRAGERDLVADLSKLAAARFPIEGRTWTLGELVLATQDRSAAERAALLARLGAADPLGLRAWIPTLSELLLDDHLHGDDWDPADDHPRDGLLTAESWGLDERFDGPWSEVSGTPRVEQGAVLYRADLATIKRVENDYRSYPEHVGADYEEIYVRSDGHLTGRDDAGRPFRFVGLRFRCDLPFPFSGYDCDLRVLNRPTPTGGLRTDIYSTSDDFRYMLGRDLYLPVRAADESIVAHLAVRDFGFDIDDVPDRAKHRREALRSTLGNLKRKAERAARPRPESFDGAASALKGLRVLGGRQEQQ